MSKKRYAIVRVDDRCPVENEEEIYLTDRVKMFPCFLDKRLSCKNCNYGDTKEQLIRKVAQVIEKNIKKKYIDVNDGKIGYFIRTQELAKEIVEFLGVEEK